MTPPVTLSTITPAALIVLTAEQRPDLAPDLASDQVEEAAQQEIQAERERRADRGKRAPYRGPHARLIDGKWREPDDIMRRVLRSPKSPELMEQLIAEWEERVRVGDRIAAKKAEDAARAAAWAAKTPEEKEAAREALRLEQAAQARKTILHLRKPTGQAYDANVYGALLDMGDGIALPQTLQDLLPLRVKGEWTPEGETLLRTYADLGIKPRRKAQSTDIWASAGTTKDLSRVRLVWAPKLAGQGGGVRGDAFLLKGFRRVHGEDTALFTWLRLEPLPAKGPRADEAAWADVERTVSRTGSNAEKSADLPPGFTELGDGLAAGPSGYAKRVEASDWGPAFWVLYADPKMGADLLAAWRRSSKGDRVRAGETFEIGR